MGDAPVLRKVKGKRRLLASAVRCPQSQGLCRDLQGEIEGATVYNSQNLLLGSPHPIHQPIKLTKCFLLKLL